MTRPVRNDKGIRFDLVDVIGDQIDIVALQHWEPMIIDQHLLTVRPIVGQHLCYQFWITVQLPLHMVDHIDADPVVGRVEGTLRIRSIWVDP